MREIQLLSRTFPQQQVLLLQQQQQQQQQYYYYEASQKTWCNGYPMGLPPQLPEDSGKLTLVLDIDETLVHTELLGGDHVETGCDDFIVTLQGLRLQVRKRPFLDSFLCEAAKKFELIAFTAGAEDYAGPLLDHIDPERKYFRHRLYRQHCLQRDGINFVKDLRLINRPMNRTVLVDNNAHSFLMQPQNGIPIESFFNNASDTALATLFRFLHLISSVEDVRVVLKQVFCLGAAFGGPQA